MLPCGAVHPIFQEASCKPRFSVVLATLLLLPALAAVATTSSGTVLQPDKLVILSTTDVKGKTSPCGCHIPKGGLYRRASLADSITGAVRTGRPGRRRRVLPRG